MECFHAIYREPTHLLKIAQHYDVKHMLLLSQYKLKATIIPKHNEEQRQSIYEFQVFESTLSGQIA